MKRLFLVLVLALASPLALLAQPVKRAQPIDISKMYVQTINLGMFEPEYRLDSVSAVRFFADSLPVSIAGRFALKCSDGSRQKLELVFLSSDITVDSIKRYEAQMGLKRISIREFEAKLDSSFKFKFGMLNYVLDVLKKNCKVPLKAGEASVFLAISIWKDSTGEYIPASMRISREIFASLR